MRLRVGLGPLVREIGGRADPGSLSAAADAVTTWSAPVRDQALPGTSQAHTARVDSCHLAGGETEAQRGTTSPAHLPLLPVPPRD